MTTEWAWTHGEWWSMAHHLRVAAATYDEDADVARKDAPHSRLVEQFAAQAKQAREMADAIEERLHDSGGSIPTEALLDPDPTKWRASEGINYDGGSE
jgi:hypothetical protein